MVITGLCVCSIMSTCLLDLLVQSLKIYIAELSMKMLFGLMLKHKRPCSFSGPAQPGENKFIPGIARNCPGVVKPLVGRSIAVTSYHNPLAHLTLDHLVTLTL